jgi:hypothetical protein
VAHGTAFSTTSSQDGCRLVTRKRACVASVVGVLPALYAHRLGRAYGPDSSPGDDTSACTAYASSTSSSLAHWLQTFEPAGSASRPARSTTPRSLRRFCRFASTPSRATLHTSCAKRSAVHSKRRHSPPEPPAHADAQPLLLTFRNRREVRDAVRLRVPGATRRAAFARASPSIGVSVSVGGRPPWSRVRNSTVGQSRPRCGSSRRRGGGPTNRESELPDIKVRWLLTQAP